MYQRLSQRADHFMGPDLLESQLATLELPEHGFTVDIDQPVDAIVQSIVDWMTANISQE